MIHKHPFVGETAGTRAHLRILETTDLHVHLLPYDYFADRLTPGIGLSCTAALIGQLRRDVANSLLFDDGDFLQGNPLSDWIATESGFGPGDLHPAIAAMNALRYDGATLGNHEFNYGLPFLRAALERADFPVVCANVTLDQAEDPAQDRLLRPAHALLERRIVTADGGTDIVRIGIIGFAPSQIVQWDRQHLGGRIGTRDIVEAARSHLPALLNKRPDLVIALCHSGIGAERHEPGMENASVPLAAVEGIDVVLTGHTHGVFPEAQGTARGAVDARAGTLHGKPAVMAGFHGSHAGVIDLLLERRDSGRWAPVAHVSAAIPVAAALAAGPVRCDPAVTATARPAHDRTLRRIRTPLGRTETGLVSHFALITPDAPSRLLAAALCRQAARMIDGRPEGGLPLLAAVAPMRTGGRGGPDNFVAIPPGPFTLRHASEIYGYPNGICVLLADGRIVADWLERSASLFLPLTPGRTDQPLIDPDFPGYNFDTLHGLSYVIDLGQDRATDAQGRLVAPGARRVRDIRLNGRPLTPSDLVLIATNSYRAAGSGGFDAARRARLVCSDPTPVRDILAAHVRATGTVAVPEGQDWHLTAPSGTGAILASAPGAIAPPGVQTRLSIRRLGRDSAGFDRFALRF